MKVRFQRMVWTDEAGVPTQCALSKWVDDDKVTEVTWTPEPFDTWADLDAVFAGHLTLQMTLW